MRRKANTGSVRFWDARIPTSEQPAARCSLDRFKSIEFEEV